MNKHLSFEEIHPFVRYAQLLQLNEYSSFTHLKAYDCRLFYVFNGEGHIWIQGIKYPVSKGNLLLWQPGIEYHLISHQVNCLEMIGLNFDFTHNNIDKDYPIPSDKAATFDDSKITEAISFSDLEAFNAPIFLRDMQMLESALLEIKTEFTIRKKYFNHKICGMFLTVLGTIARVVSSIHTTSLNLNHKVDMIIGYIHQNYHSDITNEAIGKLFNFHPNYINKLMVLHTGSSLHQYVLMHRIAEAISLIQTTSMSISEISCHVGFKDFNHFSKYFKKKTGRSPIEFRKVPGHQII